MTNPDYTAISLVIDRSGSMTTIRDAAEEAINKFINDHRTGTTRPAEKVTIRIVTFDDAYELVCPSTDPDHIPTFTLSPRGTTALLDAMARSITEFSDELASLPEGQRPGTVVYAVMTDGKENSSVEHDWPAVQAMVAHQQEQFNWHILYLAANQDAFVIGAKLGVRRGQTMTYAATDHGTRSVTDSLSFYVAAASTGRPVGFTDEQRGDAIK